MKYTIRHTHWMRVIYGNMIPRHIVTVDCLAHEVIGREIGGAKVGTFRMGVAHYVNIRNDEQQRWQKLEFHRPADFWLWLQRRVNSRTSIWIYGYKISRVFNLLGGWNLISEGLFSLTPRPKDNVAKGNYDESFDEQKPLLVDNDPPFVLLLHTASGVTIHVCDVLNYGRCTMAELMESTNTPSVLDCDEWCGDGEREQWLSSRCRAVREYVCDMMIEWHRDDRGPWRHTASGLAMAAYRKKFLCRDILVHDSPQVLELERWCLAGGYSMAYKLGYFSDDGHMPCSSPIGDLPWQRVPFRGPVRVYDVNSLYPSVMSRIRVPVHMAYWREKGMLEEVVEQLNHLVIFAEVKIVNSDYPYPVWKDKNRLWLVGNYWTSLCGDELVHAIESGHVVDVGRVSFYYHADAFSKWVREIHAERLASRMARKPIREKLYKMLLNGLCGKFGQKDQGWEWVNFIGWRPEWGMFPAPHPETGEYRVARAIAGNVQMKGVEKETLESCPAIEAAINAAARLHMYRLRCLLPHGSLVYQGCDSLHVTPEAWPILDEYLERYSGELGILKMDGEYRYGQYRGPIDYTLELEHRVAGLVLPNTFATSGRIEWDESDTARLALMRDPGGRVYTRSVSRMWGHYHPSGSVDSDGNVSEPRLE